MQDLVLVKWHDTSSHPGWRDDFETLGLTTAYTMGFLLYEDKQVLKLASTITEEDGLADVTVIPMSCVEYKAILVEKGTKKK